MSDDGPGDRDAERAGHPGSTAGGADDGERAPVLDPRAARDDAAGEHAAVRGALDATAEDRARRVLVWRPRRQVAFGRRDEHREGYEAARDAAADAGIPATRRTAGGHAVVHDGGTVAFGVTVPVAPEEVAIEDRYCDVVDAVREALEELGVPVADGEPDDAFCPGEHGLRAPDGGKLVGIAQRVRRDAALVSGVVHVAVSPEAVALYETVYGHLDVPFDDGAITGVAAVAPDVDADAVAEALARRLPGV